MHVMLSIEALSSEPNALILEIGAAKFDPMGEGVTDCYHVAIDIADMPKQIAKLFHIDLANVARRLGGEDSEDRDEAAKTDLGSALDGLEMWIDGSSRVVWGDGEDLHNTVLRRAYELLGLDAPWLDDRCYNTMTHLAPDVLYAKHGADDDALTKAVSQALHLQKIVKHLGLKAI